MRYLISIIPGPQIIQYPAMATSFGSLVAILLFIENGLQGGGIAGLWTDQFIE